MGRLLDQVPLWAVFLLTAALVLLAAELGVVVGNRVRQRSQEVSKAPLGEIVAALLGLLALMLAFTFNLAASRYDTRRALVLEEANAIGTAWWRSGLLAEPHRSEVRKMLREYVEVRLEGVQKGKTQQAIARSEALHQRLWAVAAAQAEKEPHSIAVGLFVVSLNDVIETHAKRVMRGVRTRMPRVIWGALYFIATFAMGAIGYHTGLNGARRSLSILLPILTFSVVLILIADLDTPQEGLFKVGQESLADLRQVMDGGGPQTKDRDRQ